MIRIEYSCYISLYSINLDVCRKLENSRKRYGRLYKFEIHIIHLLLHIKYRPLKNLGGRALII